MADMEASKVTLLGRWRDIRGVLLALVICASAVSACSRSFDYQFYVVNSTDETWIIRAMDQRGPNEGKYWTALVKPGADGVGVPWAGDMTNPVELLRPDCTFVGAFLAGPDGTHAVPAAPGIYGRVAVYGADLPRTNTPEILRAGHPVDPSDDCLPEQLEDHLSTPR